MKLYSYDPGQTTGWASFDAWPDTKVAKADEWGELDLWHGIDDQILPDTDLHVVYEKIVPRSLDFNPIGLEVIGAIRFRSEQVSVACTHQPNSSIHGVFKWGIYDDLFEKIRSQHSKDALAHGIVFLRRLGYEVEFDH